MAGVCDFVFLIDGTGSMGPCMEALKGNIGVFIDELLNANSGVRDWRGKVVVYRDVIADKGDWLEDNDFVRNDPAGLRAQLARSTPRGGGDEPESLLDALHVVATMGSTGVQEEIAPDRWRARSDAARIVIVFTDATFHPIMSYDGGAGGEIADVQSSLVSEKIILMLYAPDHEIYEGLSMTDKAEHHPIPGPDFVKGLASYTSDTRNFQKVLEQLAKSVSKSAAVEPVSS